MDMASFLQIAVLLAVVVGTSASISLCSLRWEDVLDCSGRGLSLPPPGLWSNVTHLLLSNNAITKLHTNSLSGFPAIRHLSLSDNSISCLRFKELVTNTDLVSLDIENNQINFLKSPPHGTTFPNLTGIFASKNIISHLDPNIFSFAPNLLTLDIKNNPLIVDPGYRVLNHPRLQTLYMSFDDTSPNVIHSSLLAGLPNLKYVDLSNANISSVAGAFVNNKKLEYIYLQINSITQITPGTFPTEGRIVILNLSENPLNTLNPWTLNNAYAWNSTVDINDTPLACECKYGELYRWAKSKNIGIRASCGFAPYC